MKKLLCCSCGLLLTTVGLRATPLFSDNFDSYSGTLAGQGTWVQNGSSAVTPIQVTGGKAMIGSSGQDLNAPITPNYNLVDGTPFYIGATINLSAAQTSGDYFLHWSPATGSSSFLSRLFAKSTTGGYLLGYVETAGGAVVSYGTTTLSLNQDYRVVIAYDPVAGTLNDTASVYVDPTSYGSEGANTPYVTKSWTSTIAESTVLGAINLRQGSATAAPTLSLDDLVVSTAFGDMQVVTVPEPCTASLVGLGLLAGTLIRRRK